MLEINGIPENVWNDTQKMLHEAMDEYVPNYLTLAVSKAILKERARCAKIASEAPESIAGTYEASTVITPRDLSDAISQAIRQHSQKGRDNE